MNLARAMAMVVLGIAGLVLAWTGIESLELANDAACRGNDKSFVKVVGPDGVSYDVGAQMPATTPPLCEVQGVATDLTESTGWTVQALGDDVLVGSLNANDRYTPPWVLPAPYTWDTDGYEIAEESLAGRIFVGAQLGMMGSLLLLVFIASLTFRELTSAWF